MLPLRFRLKKRKTFNYLHQHGKHANGQFVSVLFVPANSLKIGFTASKKVGNSVKRHRAVRLMREAVRPFLGVINPRVNIVLIAKPELLTQHLVYLTLDVEKILKSANLML